MDIAAIAMDIAQSEADLRKAQRLAEEEGCLTGTCIAGGDCCTEYLIRSYTTRLDDLRTELRGAH